MARSREDSVEVPFKDVLRRHLKDPNVARIYEELGPEFEVISQIIALRNQRKMTQAQLAKRIGTKQPSIARLEKKGQIGNLAFLKRVANALDARLEVRLVPREVASRSTPARSAKPRGGKYRTLKAD